MIVKKIELTNFRNFKNLSLEFNNKLNFIYGDNGSGKTSIVEAIYFLTFARSFRTNDLSTLINNESEYLRTSVEIVEDNLTNKISIHLDKDGKNIFVDDKKINKISSLYHYINCISYVPKDSYLLKSSPKDRRNFINLNLSKLNKTYLNNLIEYEKVLKSRNELLKQEKLDRNLLDVLTTQLIDLSYSIEVVRYDYINKLNKVLPDIYKQLTDDSAQIVVKLNEFIDDLKNFKTIAKRKYMDVIQKDILQKVTTIGVHKEDFSIEINNQNIGIYGSQGENKLAVLALKLSHYFLDEKRKNLIILDDILAELDYFHQKRLLKLLDSFSQIFITSSKKEELNLNDIWYFHIENNKCVEKEEK